LSKWASPTSKNFYLCSIRNVRDLKLLTIGNFPYTYLPLFSSQISDRVYQGLDVITEKPAAEGGLMARIACFAVPGLPHHVTQRGNRGEPVFFGDDDYERRVTVVR
jgi:hypothetical protein